MVELRKIVFVLILFVLCDMIDSTIDPNQYCDLQKYCTADGLGGSTLHIGCPENYNTAKSNYKLLKLKYNDRAFIINELNQFRSDVALGEIYANNFSSSTFSYMKKLKWDFELDHLLQLMIIKQSNTKFYCMSTDKDHKPIQLVISVNRPQPFSLEMVFSLAIEELKSKALHSFSLASRNQIINWSQCYHPDSSAFACAVGELNSPLNSNNKNILIRCAFYGKKFTKSNDDFKYGELCSGCYNDDCSDLFPGLCGTDIEHRRGVKGVRGRHGIQGYPGGVGAKGDKGTKGSIGLPGPYGLLGLKGVRGKIGVNGITGALALKGEKGLPGKMQKPDECIGSPGANGIAGPRGLDGPVGAIGESGDQGEPGSFIKGEKGEPGLHLKGDRGEIGNDGFKGLVGQLGEEGMGGDQGVGVYMVDVRFNTEDECIKCSPGQKGERGLPGQQGPPGSDVDIKSDTITREVTVDPTQENW